MKLGELDIKKAYFGVKELTSNNAYIGTVPIIEHEKVPNNEIWYTSSNGNIVTPYRPDTFPHIVSNKYVDGKGIIKFRTNITTIGGAAFERRTSLTSMSIPNSVKSIASNAFYGCSSLAYFDIPNSITIIGANVFKNCTRLTSIIIGNSVTNFGNDVFSGCSSLTKVNITNIAAWCNIAFTSIASNPLNYAKHLYINNIEATNLVIPEDVTSIGNYAFYNCQGLTSVTIPNSVTSIGEYAFYNVLNIEYHGSATGAPWGAKHLNAYIEGNIIYQDSTKTILVDCNPTAIGSIIIPNSVITIGDHAFQQCSGLTSITIGNGVTSIGAGAFSYCSGLTSINVPNSVINIGDYAFRGSSNLISVTIGNNVTNIGNYIFGYISAKILFSKLYSTYTNKIFISPNANGESYTYNVEFNISEIPTNYNISSMLPQVADSGKGTLTYNIYTDYAPCKDQALALVTQKTIVNVYHIDGTPWE